MTLLETILTIAAGLFGGLNVLQFVFFRSSKRKAKAEADSAENAVVVTAYKDEIAASVEQFNVLKETNLFLQEQLKAKEERFAEQTNTLRELNKEVLSLTNDLAKMTLKEQTYHCEVRSCKDRVPQNGY